MAMEFLLGLETSVHLATKTEPERLQRPQMHTMGQKQTDKKKMAQHSQKGGLVGGLRHDLQN
jgi:hypothetical protein